MSKIIWCYSRKKDVSDEQNVFFTKTLTLHLSGSSSAGPTPVISGLQEILSRYGDVTVWFDLRLQKKLSDKVTPKTKQIGLWELSYNPNYQYRPPQHKPSETSLVQKNFRLRTLTSSPYRDDPQHKTKPSERRGVLLPTNPKHYLTLNYFFCWFPFTPPNPKVNLLDSVLLFFLEVDFHKTKNGCIKSEVVEWSGRETSS